MARAGLIEDGRRGPERAVGGDAMKDTQEGGRDGQHRRVEVRRRVRVMIRVGLGVRVVMMIVGVIVVVIVVMIVDRVMRVVVVMPVRVQVHRRQHHEDLRPEQDDPLRPSAAPTRTWELGASAQ